MAQLTASYTAKGGKLKTVDFRIETQWILQQKSMS